MTEKARFSLSKLSSIPTINYLILYFFIIWSLIKVILFISKPKYLSFGIHLVNLDNLGNFFPKSDSLVKIVSKLIGIFLGYEFSVHIRPCLPDLHLQEDGGGQALWGRPFQGGLLRQEVHGGHEDSHPSLKVRTRHRWKCQEGEDLFCVFQSLHSGKWQRLLHFFSSGRQHSPEPTSPEAVYLVVCNHSMNELWAN